MKNYIGMVNDHSGSMANLAVAAIVDYNANIAAIRAAATTEMLDTVVSVVGIGLNAPDGTSVLRQVQISNPHVLKPITQWPCPGGTPLYDGIANMIELLSTLPDANNLDVSFLIMITTDGEEMHSRRYKRPEQLKALMDKVSHTGRWTFAFRVPKGANMNKILALGVAKGNIQEWETTQAGMAASTVSTQSAMRGFYAARAAGATSTGAFYSNAAAVNVAALEDVSKKVSLYVVDPADEGIQIRDFILKHRMEYLKGAAFYQLSKTEARVSHTKQVLVRDQATGKIFAGAQARSMIGLPTDRNARLHPGDHKAFDLFIQSESINRKLVGGSGVIYWKELGTTFSEAELAIFAPKTAIVAKPAVAQLIVVPVSTKPTKSPIAVTPRSPQIEYFETREEARLAAADKGVAQSKIQKNKAFGVPKSHRWML